MAYFMVCQKKMCNQYLHTFQCQLNMQEQESLGKKRDIRNIRQEYLRILYKTLHHIFFESKILGSEERYSMNLLSTKGWAQGDIGAGKKHSA